MKETVAQHGFLWDTGIQETKISRDRLCSRGPRGQRRFRSSTPTPASGGPGKCQWQGLHQSGTSQVNPGAERWRGAEAVLEQTDKAFSDRPEIQAHPCSFGSHCHLWKMRSDWMSSQMLSALVVYHSRYNCEYQMCGRHIIFAKSAQDIGMSLFLRLRELKCQVSSPYNQCIYELRIKN